MVFVELESYGRLPDAPGDELRPPERDRMPLSAITVRAGAITEFSAPEEIELWIVSATDDDEPGATLAVLIKGGCSDRGVESAIEVCSTTMGGNVSL